MLQQDPPHFENRERVAMDFEMIGLDGDLRGSVRQMSALERDDTIAFF